jgi:RPA family protein
VVSVANPAIFDISNANFNITALPASSITVAIPNSGSWAVGATLPITWTSVSVTGKVDIYLSRDFGTSTSWTKIISSTANDGSQAWTVTAPATSSARIKVVSVANEAIFDMSDTNFIITAALPASSITVAIPNGPPVSWAVGSTQTITWTSVSVTGKVDIQLSRDGGPWTTIISSTTNTGSRAWTVTSPKTTQAKIKVVSIANRAIFDVSDAYFTIK